MLESTGTEQDRLCRFPEPVVSYCTPPPTSLPGRHGIGDLGPEAYRFVDFLADTKQQLWQVLPWGRRGMAIPPT